MGGFIYGLWVVPMDFATSSRSSVQIFNPNLCLILQQKSYSLQAKDETEGWKPKGSLGYVSGSELACADATKFAIES